MLLTNVPEGNVGLTVLPDIAVPLAPPDASQLDADTSALLVFETDPPFVNVAWFALFALIDPDVRLLNLK